MDESSRNHVFISYAHEDESWREDFERMLAPARDRGIVNVWSDDLIAAGENWSENIRAALARARVGLLLVTDHFLESKYINKVELKRLLEAAQTSGVSIHWVPVSASLYEFSDLAALQASWNPNQPLNTLSEADRKKAIQQICQDIVAVLAAAPKASEPSRERLRAQVQERLGDKYTITHEVVTGKFSVLYRAERKQSKQAVGIKVFNASELDGWARSEFIECIERAVELRSPAFIKIYDHSMDESPGFLVSEFIEGDPLNSVLRGNPNGMRLATVKAILLDLAVAIQEAHDCGWRRGEMCPSDILIETAGAARISAMNFSNVLREQGQLTGNFMVDRESLTYMTPERFYGEASNELTDQYSLGLIATELLGGPTMRRVLHPCDLEFKHQLFASLESGRGAWAERSAEFAGLVCRMLRIAPEERWESMSEVANLLRDIEVDESPDERNRRLATSSYMQFQAGGVKGEKLFFSKFYTNLFSRADDIEDRFKDLDMEQQYRILNLAIHKLLEFRPEQPTTRKQLQDLSVRHAKLALTKGHYDHFLEAFLQTLEEFGERDPTRLIAWRATLQRGIEFIWQCEESTRPADHPA
jgi:serine/threonine protein kinase